MPKSKNWYEVVRDREKLARKHGLPEGSQMTEDKPPTKPRSYRAFYSSGEVNVGSRRKAEDQANDLDYNERFKKLMNIHTKWMKQKK